jgi:DNA-binding XRE family transcriptional regulator
MPGDEGRKRPTGAMIRAARGLLGKELNSLAELVGVSPKTISLIEKTVHQDKIDLRRRRIVESIQQRLEDDFCIEFIFADENGGDGVRIGKTR